MQKFNLEQLESRTMLAGVTVMTHGLAGNITGWIKSAAAGINKRLDGQGSVYILKVTGDLLGRDTEIASFKRESGPDPRTSPVTEIIIKLDWTDIDSNLTSTEDVGEEVAEFFMSSPGGGLPPLASLPIQFIGHSRGASVGTAFAKELGRRGIWVDQLTTLDPHPVDALDDQEMKSWTNITFADNYWREGDSVSVEPNGEHVAGTYEGDLNDTVQKDHVGSVHMAVTGYYHGTIDTSATSNGDAKILNSWYGTTTSKPARDQTGYAFARLGGVARPVNGLSPVFGGSATRVDVGQKNSQWSNADDVQAIDRQTTIGERIRLRFRIQDRDTGSNVTMFLDRDRNPLNDNNARKVAARDYAESDAVTTVRIDGSSSGVEPGKYYVYTKSTDAGGHVRYAYSRRIELVAPAQGRVMALRAPSRFSALAQNFSGALIAGHAVTAPADTPAPATEAPAFPTTA